MSFGIVVSEHNLTCINFSISSSFGRSGGDRGTSVLKSLSGLSCSFGIATILCSENFVNTVFLLSSDLRHCSTSVRMRIASDDVRSPSASWGIVSEVFVLILYFLRACVREFNESIEEFKCDVLVYRAADGTVCVCCGNGNIVPDWFSFAVHRVEVDVSPHPGPIVLVADAFTDLESSLHLIILWAGESKLNVSVWICLVIGSAASTIINVDWIGLNNFWLLCALDYISLVSVLLRACAFSLLTLFILGIVLNVEGITELVGDLAVEIV